MAGKTATAYRLALLTTVAYGLVLSIFFPSFRVEGLPALAYFTVQSNILVCLYLLAALVKYQTSTAMIIFRGTALLCISVTGLVFHIFLVPYYPELFAEGVAFRHHITHTIAPIGFLLHWLIFEQKGQLRLGQLKFWLIYPFLYWLGTLTRGLFVGAYPYFFLDPTLLSPWQLLLWFVIIVTVFIVAGLLIIMTDQALRDRVCNIRNL